MNAEYVSVSANVSAEIGEMLDRVSKAEERSKSYYIKKGLEIFLKDRLEDLEDYEEAKKAHEIFMASGEEAVPLEDVFRDVK